MVAAAGCSNIRPQRSEVEEAMKREFCATRNHIRFDNYKAVPDRPEVVGIMVVLKGCRYSLVVWLAVASIAYFVVGWKVAAFLLAGFLVLFLVAFGVRLFRGHTVRCSLLGGVSSSLRVVNTLS
ncbi:hypothetical protein [Streptomyces sp. NPDC102283]|uniref:hypothetical protein n=1 Tax=Streptomyces sp. NPDC102283 TaxID=3366155 RepID=UPI00382F754A